MILETAVFTVRPEEGDQFLAAFAKGRRFIESSKGFHKLELRRGIEEPGTFILVVWWQSLEDHTIAFKQSANFTQWRETVGYFFAAPAVVHHYSEGV